MRPPRPVFSLGVALIAGIALYAPGPSIAHATPLNCVAGVRVEATTVDCVLPPGATITLVVKSGNGGAGGVGGPGGRGGDYRFWTGTEWIRMGVGARGGIGGAGGSGGAGAKESVTWTNTGTSSVTLRLSAPAGTGTSGASGAPGTDNGPGTPNMNPLAGGAGGAGAIGASAGGSGGAGGPGGRARDSCCGIHPSSNGGAGGAGGSGAAGASSQVVVVESSQVLAAPAAGGGGSGGSGGLGGVGATLSTLNPTDQPAGAAGAAGTSPASALVTSNSETPHVEITSVVLPGLSVVTPAASVRLDLDAREGTCRQTSITGHAGEWVALPAASECAREGWILMGWLARGVSAAFDPGASVRLFSDNTLAAVWKPVPPTPAAPALAQDLASRSCPVVWSAGGAVLVGDPASLRGRVAVVDVVAPGGRAPLDVITRARDIASQYGARFLGVVPARAWKAPRILASCATES